jgi:hypothetical protein
LEVLSKAMLDSKLIPCWQRSLFVLGSEGEETSANTAEKRLRMRQPYL